MAIVGETSVHFRRIFSNVWRNCTPGVTNYNVSLRNNHSAAGVTEDNQDVIIVGGGMVGTALAVALG